MWLAFQQLFIFLKNSFLLTQDKKLFDPIKAKAQIEVYKEIYRMEEQENLPEDQRKDVRKQDGALRILQTASENDVE